MGKIVMPKNSALLNEVESVLKIYYEADGWLENSVYKEKLKEMIGADQYSSSYTKKAQITSYFGFTEWENINNPQSKRRITESGKKMFEALKENTAEKIQSVLMNSLEKTTFGRNNFGCPESNSDIEPPVLFIRAIIDMGYLTYKEFAYMLWKLEDLGANYTDTLKELRLMRENGNLNIGEEAIKYTDCKPIMILIRWGFLAEVESNSSTGKHIIIEQSVLNKYETRLKNLKIYNIDMDIDIEENNSTTESLNDEDTKEVNKHRIKGGSNILFYGVPGCGKSYEVNKISPDENYMERVVFHPDYTYSDFVGQILPMLDENKKIKYDFSQGPFTRILKKAYKDPNHMYYLIIEEINRGNAPAIFGEIFQLLDRNDLGESEYGITNYDIADIVSSDSNKLVKIPSNLSLVATMNTSDQNVFTLDTAFQRRWKMKHISNKFDNEHADEFIKGTSIRWGAFATVINNVILDENRDMTSIGDKRLGAYFVKGNELEPESFSEKVLKYLWDDVFSMEKGLVFDERYKSLEEIIEVYESTSEDKLEAVLRENIYKSMLKQSYKEETKKL